MTQHFIDLWKHPKEELRAILNEAHARKKARNGAPKGRPDKDAPLKDRTLAMIFEKNSTRTRFSFDMAIRQLGGSSIVVSAGDMQLGRGESIEDTARVLSRYVDAVMIRANKHSSIEEFARHCTLPVVNGLTNKSHPCQIMADLQTLEERGVSLKDASIAWVGDGNNVAASFVHAAPKFGYRLAIGARVADGEPLVNRICGERPGLEGEEDPGGIERVKEAVGIANEHPAVAGHLPGAVGVFLRDAVRGDAFGGGNSRDHAGTAGHFLGIDRLRVLRFPVLEEIVEGAHDADADDVVLKGDVPKPAELVVELHDECRSLVTAGVALRTLPVGPKRRLFEVGIPLPQAEPILDQTPLTSRIDDDIGRQESLPLTLRQIQSICCNRQRCPCHQRPMAGRLVRLLL